jgi:hypothetical protein
MLSTDPLSPPSLETEVTTIVHRTAAGLALGMLGTLFAAAVYTEAHRAPDQS